MKKLLNYRCWKLHFKIMAISTLSTVVVVAAFFTLSHRDQRHATHDDFVHEARSIALTAESVREEMARKWALGLFDQHQLVGWASEGELEKVLGAVPVVTAWKSAMARAEEGNYEFRVPKFQPRNPANEPDELEAEALNAFKADDALTEYVIHDREKNAVRYFRPIRLTSECLLCHGNPANSRQLWGNDQGLDPTGAPMEDWKEGEVHGAFEVVQSLNEADARTAAAFWRQLGIISVLAAGGCGLVFFVIRQAITRPIRQTVESCKKLAAGDLSETLEVKSQDEIGELRTSVNQVTASLRSTVKKMTQCAGHLSQSSDELASTANELAGGAEQTKQQSNTVAAAAEEMSANMTNMASSSEQMSNNVKSVSTSIEGMTAAISEVAGSSEQAAQVADKAAELASVSNERVGELGSAAEEIGKVIGVIQDIAEQTNLLALNATIEAARAGDVGKGFAVVANEVKELAAQTAEATEDIRRRVEGIQSSSGEAISAISHIVEVVAEVNQASRTIAAAVEEQSISTQEIAQHVADAYASSNDVSDNVRETAVASREVAENIAKVDDNARHTSDDAGRMQASARHLSELAIELHQAVSHFKLSGESVNG